MIILGTDPGKSGALAWFDTQAPGAIHVVDMPVVGDEVVPALILSQIERGYGRPDWVYIERQGPRPIQGTAQAFGTGLFYGMLRGIFAASLIPQCIVTPQVWKKHHGLIKEDKDQSRAKAIAIWPAHADLFKRKKDDGRAEAALIALYGAREQTQNMGIAA